MIGLGHAPDEALDDLTAILRAEARAINQSRIATDADREVAVRQVLEEDDLRGVVGRCCAVFDHCD